VTVVETRVTHAWQLVAPWWHWPLAAGASDADRAAVRVSAPALQKYDSPDLVNGFLADPQHRLKFQPHSDEVATVTPGKKGFGSIPERKPTGRRKLYLGSHHRHYLVVCSLHCDLPGFPNADRGGVCQAGFVVRRRSDDLPPAARGQAALALRRHTAARRRREGVELQIAAARQAGRAGGLRVAALGARLEALRRAEDENRQALQAWAQRVGAQRTLEGWVPQGFGPDSGAGPMPACGAEPSDRAPLAGIGGWQRIDELPEALAEATFPLYPLVADPTRPAHDATGETIYFGVVPTGSSDVDLAGSARFDDTSAYEIRCFVRRHRAECPRDGRHCRCPIVWSATTDPYQFASHHDLEGSANRSVTVQLPDLAQLHADALRLGPGGTGGVRFRSPPRSELPFTANNLDATAIDPPKDTVQICSFAIPLITIVAMFLLKLVMPIVVFVFQLWFLLMLRFCIPPDVRIGTDLAAAFDALGPGLEIDETAADNLITQRGAEIDNALEGVLGGTRDRSGTKLSDRIRQARSGGALDNRSFVALARSALAQDAAPPPAPVFAPRVRRDEVVSP
jgi:hypothetical protein